MQSQGLATADHTTLLLNCYTKLKDVAKLDEFLHRGGADSGTPALNFDVDTAVKVRVRTLCFAETLSATLHPIRERTAEKMPLSQVRHLVTLLLLADLSSTP